MNKALQQHENRVPRAAREQAALGPDHAWHHHRRRRGDRHGGGGRGRHRAHPAADRLHRQQRHHRSAGQHHQFRRRPHGKRQRADADRRRRHAPSRANAPPCMLAAPAVQRRQQVVYGNNNWGTQIMGTTPDYLAIRDIRNRRRRSHSPPTTSKSTAKVALLGKTVVDNLFTGEDPMGKIIRIKKVPFTVVGTLVPKGQSPSGPGSGRRDPDADHHRQEESDRRRARPTAAAVGADHGAGARRRATPKRRTRSTALLRQRHQLQATEDDDFTIRNMEEVFAAQERLGAGDVACCWPPSRRSR